MKKPIQIIIGLTLLTLSAYAYCSSDPFDYSCNPSLKFKNVEEFKHVALNILNSKSAKNVHYSTKRNAMIAEFPKCKTIYAITDATNSAFPSIAKIAVVQKAGKVYIKEGVATLASKEKISAWMSQLRP